MDEILSTPCPACGQLYLILETRWDTSDIGTFSLAGMQMKLPAVVEIWIRCLNCGVEAKGHRS